MIYSKLGGRREQAMNLWENVPFEQSPLKDEWRVGFPKLGGQAFQKEETPLIKAEGKKPWACLRQLKPRKLRR